MYEIDREKFGEFLAELRKEKGIKQKDLAEKLYVSDKAVSKWETGHSIPDVSLLVPLAEILGVTVTELLECKSISEFDWNFSAIHSSSRDFSTSMSSALHLILLKLQPGHG